MPESHEEIVITDHLGREHVFDTPPERIVSLVPSITETLVLLGAREKLVGRTKFCIRPEGALSEVQRVGGTKNPEVSKILSLAPDVVIANKEENQKRHIEALEKNIRVLVTYPRTVRETIQTVLDMGTLVDARDQAERFRQKCESLLYSIERDHAASRPLRTACMIWRDPWMAVGPDTYASDLLGLFGFHTIFKRSEGRYPCTTLEDVVSRRPDVILLPDEPYEFGQEDRAFVKDFLEEQGASARVMLLEGDYLTWFGLRTLEALHYLGEFKKELG